MKKKKKRRRKEKEEEEKKKKKKKKQKNFTINIIYLQTEIIILFDLLNFHYLYVNSPFVERSGPFLREHADGAVDCTAVLSRSRVHVSRLDDVDGRGGHRGAEPRDDSRREMTRDGVAHQTVMYEQIFDDVIAHNLAHIHNRVAAHIRESSWKR